MNVTAGAFYEILQDQNVDVSLFSSVIFDECHYLKANRVHVEIMKRFMCQKVPYQPRVVGLTALQFAANNLDQAWKNFKKIFLVLPYVFQK